MERKKILFVLQSLRTGGAEKELVTVANALVQTGYDVTVLIWKPIFTYKDELDERVHLIYKAPDEHLGNKIPYIRYRFYDDCMWELRATPEQLYRYYVGWEKYDVEIAFFHGLAVDIIGGSTNRDSLKIAWVHNNMERLETKEQIEKARKMYSRIHNIVCVSKASRESFLRIIGDTGSVRVIYNMLPIESIRQQAQLAPPVSVKKAAFHVVMVARFHSPKGHQRLINAIIRLRKEGRDISLSLIGIGDDEPLILEQIAVSGAEDYISVVTEPLNPFPYVKEADLLVCASYLEGFNLTIAEAMILGVPVLSTDCAGPRELLDGGRYGMLTENSEQGLYNGIRELYENPELLEEYRRKAIERQSFFDEEKALREITALFEEQADE